MLTVAYTNIIWLAMYSISKYVEKTDAFCSEVSYDSVAFFDSCPFACIVDSVYCYMAIYFSNRVCMRAVERNLERTYTPTESQTENIWKFHRFHIVKKIRLNLRTNWMFFGQFKVLYYLRPLIPRKFRLSKLTIHGTDATVYFVTLMNPNPNDDKIRRSEYSTRNSNMNLSSSFFHPSRFQ